jgi:hypothetical protein
MTSVDDEDKKRRRKRCRRCGAALAACTCLGMTVLGAVPPHAGHAGLAQVVAMAAQRPGVPGGGRPDVPHDPDRDYATPVPGTAQEIAPPPARAAALRGEGFLTAGGAVEPAARLAASGQLS